jgi:hypothetical protein
MTSTGGQGSGWEWHITETYKALVTLAVEALKMLALVNGGAAVGVLTYLGNLVSRSGAPIPDLRPALLWYSGGLLATILAFIVAYVTQLRLYTEERARHTGARFRELHWIGTVVAGLLAVFAAVAFGLGSWDAAGALTQQVTR